MKIPPSSPTVLPDWTTAYTSPLVTHVSFSGEHLLAGQSRERKVEDHDVDVGAGGELEPARPVGRQDDHEPVRLEALLEERGDAGLVFDDDHVRACAPQPVIGCSVAEPARWLDERVLGLDGGRLRHDTTKDDVVLQCRATT